jgi:hypothetical protein
MKDIDKEYWYQYKISHGNLETLLFVIVAGIAITLGYIFAESIGALIGAIIYIILLISCYRESIINRNLKQWEIDEWRKIIKRFGITDNDLRNKIAEMDEKYYQERRIKLNSILNRIKKG